MIRDYWYVLNRHGIVTVALVALLYTVFAVIITHPVAWRLGDGIAGIPGDSYHHLWSLWWGEKALLELHTSLADVSMLYFPQEVEHPILAVTPLIQIAAAPLVVLFGPIVAYNLGFLLSTIFSGITTYLLAYEITRDSQASFVGGLIFAFAPTRLIHGLGHYAQIMTFLFPLYLLFLVRYLKRPTLKTAIAVAITLALSMLVNFLHVAYFIIPATLILVGYAALKDWPKFRQRGNILGLAMAAGLAFLMTAPFILPFLFSGSEGGLNHLQSGGVAVYGADLLAFFLPSPLHPLFSGFPALQDTLTRIVAVGFRDRNLSEGLVYLGVVPLFLAIWGVVQDKERARPWLVLLLITAVFSLGPFLRFNGELVTYEIDGKSSHIIMPYALLTRLPLYELARTPSRINATTMMALAVLVSVGAATILARWRSHTGRRRLFVGGVTVIILLEYIVLWPYPFTVEPIPPLYEEIAAEPGEFGILDYPMYLDSAQLVHGFDLPMYYQLVHERPIAGGRIWRLAPDTSGTMRSLEDLISPQALGDIVPLPPLDQRASVLNQLGFRYVIVHKNDIRVRAQATPDELETVLDHLSEILGPPIYDDQYIAAFRVPETEVESGALEPLFALGENWLGRVVDQDSIWRWSTGEQSRLRVYSQSKQAHRLSFEAYSSDEPRNVVIFVNDEPIGELVIDESRRFVTPHFYLEEGQNEILLESMESCRLQAPDEPPGEENPCLGIRVSDIRLTTEDQQWGEHPVNCEFGDKIGLLGYEFEPSNFLNGEKLDLTLYWQAASQIDENYTVFTHLLDEDGQIVAQVDSQPVSGKALTSWWTPGEIIVDSYEIPVGEAVPQAGELTLRTGMYLWPSGQRLAVDSSCSGADLDNSVTLTTLQLKGTP
jgi:hypothetical protein